jgi:uncharacterized membrane protein
MDPEAQPSPLAAQCQLHAGQPFTGVCQRCGTYMCAVCSEGGRHTLCASCRQRSGVGSFPFRRDAYTLSALLEYAFSAYKQQWLPLVAGVVILFVAVFGIAFVGSFLSVFFMDSMPVMLTIRAVFMVPQLIVQGACTLGLMHMFVKVARGEQAEISDLFAAWRKLGPWLVQSLVIFAVMLPAIGLSFGLAYLAQEAGAGVFAPVLVSLLLVPLMFYVMMGAAFANLEIVAQPGVGAIAGLSNSWALARGKRLELLLIGLILFGLYVGGVVACLVGALFTMTYGGVLFCSYYLALRNGATDLRA